MFKNPFFHKRTVVITWLLSYALIISVPLLIAGLTYIEAQSVIRREINQSNTFLLKRLQQRMDSVLKDIRKLEVDIMFDKQINEILLSDKEISDILRYTISKAVENFKVYKLSNNTISAFFIYYRDLDLIISNSTSTDSKTFYLSLNRYEKKGYEKWLKLLQAEYRGAYIPQPSGSDDSYKNNKITYINSLPVIRKTPSKANLVIMADDEEFLREAEGIRLTKKETVLILNNNNAIISSTGFIDSSWKFNYRELSGTEGVLNKSYMGNQYVVSYIASAVTGWKYISLIPMEVFWEKADYIRKLSITGLFICLFIGCILAFLLTKKNYSPLKKLVKSFQNQLEPVHAQNCNEYSYLQQIMNRMVDTKKELSCRLDQQNRILKIEFISRLLKGKEGIGISLNDLLLSYNIKFETTYFAVMVFFIKSLDLSTNEDKGTGNVQTETEVFKFIQLIIINLVEQLMGKNNQGFVTETDDLLVCLINFKETGLSDWKAELQRVASEIRTAIGKCYDINFIISISNIHETIAGIPEAYREALQAMEYMRVMDVDKDTFFGEINQLPEADYYFPLEKEYQLINRIKAGESATAQSLLEDLFDKNHQGSIHSIQFARWFILDIASSIIKAVNDLDEIKRDDILKELSMIETLINSKSMNEIKELMKHIIDKICRFIQEKKTTSRIKAKVMEYVEKNYNDINLRVAKIAWHFDMHPVYLSGEFKKLSGIGLLDYIHRIRIEKAKEILKKQKDNLEEIAHKVGYTNVRTFSRLFIRNEGTTPGKFREKD